MPRIGILTAADVRSAVDMPEAIDAMREAFAALSRGEATVPLRVSLDTERGVVLVMPAHLPSVAAAGAKVVSVHPGNRALGLPSIHAAVLLVDPATGAPTALMDGASLTALRTGAAGGLAAELLAREDARVVALFGAGVQARSQLEAVRCVRAIDEVRIVSRTRASARALAAEVRGCRAYAVDDAAEALSGADIVITATSSATPVFPGGRVAPGTHVTGVGSYTPRMQEVDADLVSRAVVVVDQREAALREAGDLIHAVESGRWKAEEIHAELGEIVAGSKPGRVSPEEITFFKSVGNAAQDMALARRVVDAAARLGLGTEVDL